MAGTLLEASFLGNKSAGGNLSGLNYQPLKPSRSGKHHFLIILAGNPTKLLRSTSLSSMSSVWLSQRWIFTEEVCAALSRALHMYIRRPEALREHRRQ
ncbi:MAG TPA: hypothetical protein VJA21_12155 [Verrucomicrobiae bacterium]